MSYEPTAPEPPVSSVAYEDEAEQVHNTVPKENFHNKVSSSNNNMLRDIYEWRRKDLSLLLLLVSTAIWVVLQVYQFNFIPLAAYAAIFVLTSAFIWGNLLRIFGKEGPSMSGVEIPEEWVRGIAYSIKETGDETVRWMFRVGAENEWFVFAGSVAALWLLSLIGTFTDLITFLYMGTVVGMTVPVIYRRYDYKIKVYLSRVREQGKRFYSMVDEKVIRKVKDMAGGHQNKAAPKEHKME